MWQPDLSQLVNEAYWERTEVNLGIRLHAGACYQFPVQCDTVSLGVVIRAFPALRHFTLSTADTMTGIGTLWYLFAADVKCECYELVSLSLSLVFSHTCWATLYVYEVLQHN